VNPAAALGTRLMLMLGPEIAVPAPAPIVEALESVEVQQSSEGRDGFQFTFGLGRGATDVVDYPLLANPLLRPFTRVVVVVIVGAPPRVLIDGFITNHQISATNDPGGSRLTVTGEDARVMMDLRQVPAPYPQMPSNLRVLSILARYALYLGAPPVVIPPLVPDAPLAIEALPVQMDTDLHYVESLASDHDYVFYIEPTEVPMVNIAYWGPENRLSIPQSALSVNLGPATNVESLSFSYDALAPTTVLGMVEEKRTRTPLPVITFASLRPPLAALPALLVQQPHVRSVLAPEPEGGDYVQAYARAQALTNRSTDVVTAEGELDAARFGDLLRARRLVGVRGAGWLLDGFWYVKRVSTRIRKGEIKQSFSLVREGFGSITPVVVP
jgi:hypothetical protein